MSQVGKILFRVYNEQTKLFIILFTLAQLVKFVLAFI